MGTILLWLFGIAFALCLLGAIWDEFIEPLIEKIAYGIGYIIGILLIPAVIVGVIVVLGKIF